MLSINQVVSLAIVLVSSECLHVDCQSISKTGQMLGMTSSFYQQRDAEETIQILN